MTLAETTHVDLSMLREIPGEAGYFAAETGAIYSVRKLSDSSLLKGMYRRVGLSHGITRTTHTVHRLVCLAFHGPPPDGKPLVRHIDGDSLNNHYANLMWGNKSENADDAVAHGKLLGLAHPDHPITKERRA